LQSSRAASLLSSVKHSKIIFKKGLCEKAVQPKQFEVFFREEAHAFFHPADQNEAGKARGLTE
jgi:hypothetical protein